MTDHNSYSRDYEGGGGVFAGVKAGKTLVDAGIFWASNQGANATASFLEKYLQGQGASDVAKALGVLHLGNGTALNAQQVTTLVQLSKKTVGSIPFLVKAGSALLELQNALESIADDSAFVLMRDSKKKHASLPNWRDVLRSQDPIIREEVDRLVHDFAVQSGTAIPYFAQNVLGIDVSQHILKALNFLQPGAPGITGAQINGEPALPPSGEFGQALGKSESVTDAVDGAALSALGQRIQRALIDPNAPKTVYQLLAEEQHQYLESSECTTSALEDAAQTFIKSRYNVNISGARLGAVKQVAEYFAGKIGDTGLQPIDFIAVLNSDLIRPSMNQDDVTKAQKAIDELAQQKIEQEKIGIKRKKFVRAQQAGMVAGLMAVIVALPLVGEFFKSRGIGKAADPAVGGEEKAAKPVVGKFTAQVAAREETRNAGLGGPLPNPA